jgi:ABC-type multidrug transport system ATPase subunit
LSIASPCGIGGQLALDLVTFDIQDGAITGLLGRNGAGKPVTEL